MKYENIYDLLSDPNKKPSAIDLMQRAANLSYLGEEAEYLSIDPTASKLKHFADLRQKLILPEKGGFELCFKWSQSHKLSNFHDAHFHPFNNDVEKRFLLLLNILGRKILPTQLSGMFYLAFTPLATTMAIIPKNNPSLGSLTMQALANVPGVDDFYAVTDDKVIDLSFRVHMQAMDTCLHQCCHHFGYMFKLLPVESEKTLILELPFTPRSHIFEEGQSSLLDRVAKFPGSCKTRIRYDERIIVDMPRLRVDDLPYLKEVFLPQAQETISRLQTMVHSMSIKSPIRMALITNDLEKFDLLMGSSKTDQSIKIARQCLLMLPEAGKVLFTDGEFSVAGSSGRRRRLQL